jgi:putative ABC transport system permease protein
VLLLRQAWKELRVEPRFALLFLFNLALGLSGLVSMEAFRDSLQVSLKENAQNLLSADMAVTSRRPLTESERQAVAALSKEAEAESSLTETFSMIGTPAGSRLVSLKAIGENYPLRGYVDLEEKGRLNEGEASKELGADRIWIDPDLARQLNLKKGDSLPIGSASFLVDDFVSFDPTMSFRALALAGRILLSGEGLGRTGLIRPESTVSFVRLYRLRPGASAENLAEAANARLTDPSVQARPAADSAEQSGRMLLYLGDFLGLSALVALFLSSLGSAYLFRTWLVKRSRAMAMHQVLGLTFAKAAAIPAFQALMLAAAALPLALLLGRIELEALEALIRGLSPVAIKTSLSLSSVLLPFAIAAFGSFLLALPFLASLRQQQPKDLLGGKLPDPRLTPGAMLLFLPAGLLLYSLSVYEAQSYRTAGIFFGALLGSLLILLSLGAVLLKAVGLVAARIRGPWPIRHAFLHLSRKGFHSLWAFVAIALGALLLNLLPQLRAGLLAELEAPTKLPSLFLFDIQDDQLSPLQEKLKAEGLQIENLSPLVRARLLQVNGQAYERSAGAEGFRTREEENEARFRNRGFNLSYRADLSDAEEIIEGRPFSGTGEEISLEHRFADRVGIKIGDTLLFDVQGVEVRGKVVNLRKVRWMSFQPNFFVTFNDGPLNGAPKIFLGSLANMPDDRKASVQSLIAKDFPNVSVVDVKATVNRALDLADRMRWSLNLMSAISLFAGFVVLFSIASRQAEIRRWDINLQRVLGAAVQEVRFQQLSEFALLSFFGALVGSLISVLFSWVTSLYFFEGVFTVSPLPLFFSGLGTTFMGLAVSWIGTRSAWRRKASELLQEQPL